MQKALLPSFWVRTRFMYSRMPSFFHSSITACRLAEETTTRSAFPLREARASFTPGKAFFSSSESAVMPSFTWTDQLKAFFMASVPSDSAGLPAAPSGLPPPSAELPAAFAAAMASSRLLLESSPVAAIQFSRARSPGIGQ